MGKYAEALDCINKAIKINPKDSDVRDVKADIIIHLGEQEAYI